MLFRSIPLSLAGGGGQNAYFFTDRHLTAQGAYGQNGVRPIR